MGVDQPLDGPGAEKLPHDAAATPQRLPQFLSQRSPEPRPQGHAESPLWPVDERRAQLLAQDLPERQLAQPAVKTRGQGHPPHQLKQLMVQQRRPRLQRNRHAGAVDFHHQVLGNVVAAVHRAHLVDRIARRRETIRLRGGTPGPGNLRPQQPHQVRVPIGLPVAPPGVRDDQVDQPPAANPLGPEGTRRGGGGEHQPAGQPIEHSAQAVMHRVAGVAGQQLVAPVAGKGHRDILPGELRDQQRGHGAGVGQWFIENLGHLADGFEQIGGRHDAGPVAGAEMFGRLPCPTRLVELRFAEADRKRVHRHSACTAHRADHHGRVEPSGEERAQGNVAHQSQPDRLLQLRGEGLLPLPGRAGGVGPVIHRPIGSRIDPGRIVQRDHGTLGRPQFANPGKNRPRRRHEALVEVVDHRRRVELGIELGQVPQGLGLRGKRHALTAGKVVERLLAESVPCQKQPPPGQIENRQGKHPPQMLDQPVAPLLVAVDQHLRVGVVRVEAVPQSDQFPPQQAVVVDFAVERHPDRARLVGHRLGGFRREVDDGQPAMSEEKVGPARGRRLGDLLGRRVQQQPRRPLGQPPQHRPPAVGTPVRYRPKRPPAGGGIDRLLARDLSENATHGGPMPFPVLG